jgi:phosphoribosylaminoimidazole-succinocarboxamide synthase
MSPATLELPLLPRGKVRDVYDLGEHVLLVATDRISAFDVVLPTPIPGKGAVLTQMSAFWFGPTEHLVPNHLVAADVDAMPPELRLAGSEALAGPGRRRYAPDEQSIRRPATYEPDPRPCPLASHVGRARAPLAPA